jgi:translation initiation factor IF-2
MFILYTGTIILVNKGVHMAEVKIGKIEDYFAKIEVAAIKVEKEKIKVGDTLRVLGHTTDLSFTIESMQVEHQSVQEAGPGDSVGIKVPDKVRSHDVVYKVT